LAFPNFKLEAAFATTDPFSASPTYTDISSRLKAVTWTHERQRELDSVNTGQSQITVDNSDRAFELMYASGAYYPNVRPDIRVRLSVSIGGGGYTSLFVHYIDDIVPPWSNVTDDTAILQCQDAFSLFQLADLALLFPQQNVHDRVGAILDYVGWPTADRNITAGGTTLPTVTFKSTDNAVALDQLRQASDSRPGMLAINNSGQVVSSGFTGPAGALPSTIGYGGVDFTAAQPRSPRSGCYNVIKAACSAPPLNSLQTDSTSITEHKRRVLSKSVLATTQAGIDSCASSYLARYKYPVETFDQIAIHPTTDTGYTLLAAVDIGSTGTVARHQDVGADYSQSVTVNAHQHTVDIGNQSWTCVMRASARQVT
jgi:hypothetical protein